jgi:IPT/TIG domain
MNLIWSFPKRSREYALGQYTPDPTLNCSTTEENRTDLDKVLQEYPPGTINGGMHNSPSYWNGSAGEFVYFVGDKDHAKAFKLSNGSLSSLPTSQSPESFNWPGGNMIISSNGSTVGTGVAWVIGSNGVFYAYDATNLATELYNSSQNSSRDGLPSYTKFSVPTVVNGEVFVGTHSTLDVYGLLPTSTAPVINSVSPNSGLVSTNVTLTGLRFGSTQDGSVVQFGTTTASVTNWSDTSIMVTVPNTLTPGVYNVTVTVGGQTGNSQTFTVTSTANPYNNVGISDDSNPSAADFDGGGASYSAQALQAAGVTPGQTIVYNNVSFIWPNVPSGTADNYHAVGQTLTVTPVSGATTLAFLGASTHGPSSGTAIITYSDGTTQNITLGMSDWTLNGGGSSPSFGNQLAITTTYRNHSGGSSETVNTYVFYTDFTLLPGKTVVSVTLPSSVSAGPLHVFAIGTK